MNAGAIVGVLLAFLVIGGVVLYVRRRRRTEEEPEYEEPQSGGQVLYEVPGLDEQYDCVVYSLATYVGDKDA